MAIFQVPPMLKKEKKKGKKNGLQRSDRVHAKQAQIKFKCQA
jgi:hypothetical protein